MRNGELNGEVEEARTVFAGESWAPEGDGPRWDDPQFRSTGYLEAGAWLTHLSDRSEPTGYRELPRWDHEHRGHTRVEVSMSMLAGRLSSSEAQMAVRRMSAVRPGVKVRRFLVGDVEHAGYHPMGTPTRSIPNHVSVFGDLRVIIPESTRRGGGHWVNDLDAHMRWWNNPSRTPLSDLVREEGTS